MAWRPLVNITATRDFSMPWWSPPCESQVTLELPFPWRQCQMAGGYPLQGEGGKGLVFAGLDWTLNGSTTLIEDPFKDWLLCGTGGGGCCTLLNPLAFVAEGGMVEFGEVNYTENASAHIIPRSNVSVPATPVCVWPPFLFILTNTTNGTLLCAQETCVLSQCWNGTRHSRAIIAHIPTSVPIPALNNPVPWSYRRPRDFGISLAIAIAAAASTAAIATAVVAMQGQAQTAAVLVNVSRQSAAALDTQMALNAQLRGGILILNQRVDLLQDQMDNMWGALSVGCRYNFPGLCMTSHPYQNHSFAAELSRNLSSLLTDEWNNDFDQLIWELRLAVNSLNNTQIDFDIQQGLSNWFAGVGRWFASWGGLGASCAVTLLIICFLVWCLYRLRHQQYGYRLLTQKAIMALETGADPQVWLASMDDM
ncbi:uncharacterized protein LOC141519181 [Macrotis lagotis]|uniref:uncharacterized protein LOC141519181 n=1 Tax=Macrotis lagotis TaxID=92651 RepID=UPI003D69B9FD